MTVNELIEVLEDLKTKHGGDIEVRKLKHLDYLTPIFKDSVVYNKQNNIIEL